MYNTKYECRYNKDDVFLESDTVNDYEKDFIRNFLYKEDLINIFNIDDNDDDNVFTNSIHELYKLLENYLPIKECMKSISSNILFNEDEIIGLCLLYSYDYMYITHKCVSEYLETGSISEENINLLKRILK